MLKKKQSCMLVAN